MYRILITRRTRRTRRSRVRWLKCFVKKPLNLWHAMIHAQSSYCGLLSPAHYTRTPSLLFSSHRRDSHCDLHPGAEFSRLAEQSPITAYEPNDLIEVNNSEVTPIFFQRRTSRASTYNSGEDTVANPTDSEVDDAQIVRILASPLYVQEREASADPSRNYHSNRGISLSKSSVFRSSAGRPAPKFSHQSKSSKESHSDTGRVFGEHQQVQELLEIRANRAARGEQEALSKLSEEEYHTIILLGEQRSQIRSEARFELLLQETRAEHAVDSIQNLSRQLCSQDAEICRRGQEECGVAQQEHVLLRSELQSRERVPEEARNRYLQEVEELKRAQELRTDEFSRKEFRESKFIVNELTAQIQELQDKVTFLNDSREFQDVESACYSRLSHVPSQLVVIPSPCEMLSRDCCQRSDTRDSLGT